jgi:hypothetical protein
MKPRHLLLFVTIVLLVSAVQALAVPPRVIVKEKFTVGLGEYETYKFKTDGPAQVVGQFEVEGRFANDVDCMLMDSESFFKWRKGEETKQLYKSGRVRSAKLDVKVPAGEYYLIFDNSFTLFTNRTIVADVEARDPQ